MSDVNGHSKLRTGFQPKAALPLPLVAFLLAMILPVELSLYVGPLFLTPLKIIFAILTVPMLASFVNSEDKFSVDYLFVVMTFLLCIGSVVKLGLGGIEPSGQIFLETAVPYIVARQYFTNQLIMRRFILVIGSIILVMGVLAIPEAISWVRYLHAFTRSITGIVYDIQADIRVGLLRAASTFEHPILFGLFSAAMFSMIWYGVENTRTKIFLSLGCAIATVLSLSSAAILLLIFQVLAISIERYTLRVPRRTLFILIAIVFMIVLIEVLSNRGVIRVIISYGTFNPQTGYYRLLQWDYAQDDVWRNPIWGMANVEEWTRPFWMATSVDNNWLFLAMKNGLLVAILNIVILASLVFKVYMRKKLVENFYLKRIMAGWIITILAIFLGGWTVAFFGKMHPMLYFLVGMGAAIFHMPDENRRVDILDENDLLGARLSPYSRFPVRNRHS